MCSAHWWRSLLGKRLDLITEEGTLRVRRAPILLALFVLLACAMSGCNTGTPTVDLEGTIVARVVATLESAETASAATQAPPEPTATPVPEPTAIPEPTVTPPREIETEEYAVYSALVRQNPIGYDLGTSFVVKEQTVSDLDMFEWTLERVDTLPSRLVDSYRSRNAATYTLAPNLDVEQGYVMMPQDEFEQIFLRKGSVWTRFQAKYPEAGGLITFSRVGFDAQGDQALALMGFRCGDLCGAGGLYLLVKEEGSWKVQETLMIWES
jgi:hypothetical protein